MALILIGISVFMHAGWNLLAHARRSDGMLLLRATFITGAVGVLPALYLELRGPAFPAQVWGLLALTGLCQSIYFFALIKGYSSGDFTVVYPLARALPVLFLAFFDVARGRMPSPLGWAGMLLVVAGCALAPLNSLRNATLARYRNRALLWALVTALGTVGYTAIDKIAAEALPPGPVTAARYQVMEVLATLPFLWIALRYGSHGQSARPDAEQSRTSIWLWSAVAALFITGAYWLILWAYQLSPYASYISALRQFSIVIGVVVAAVILHEPARLLRIGAALVIVAGIICIAFAAI